MTEVNSTTKAMRHGVFSRNYKEYMANDAGKGDDDRLGMDRQKYAVNFDRIFGKKNPFALKPKRTKIVYGKTK